MTEEQIQKWEDEPLVSLGLSARPFNALTDRRDGPVTTVGELLRFTRAELLRMKNMGAGSVRKVEEKLAAHGLFVGMLMQQRPSLSTVIDQDRERFIQDVMLAVIEHLEKRLPHLFAPPNGHQE